MKETQLTTQTIWAIICCCILLAIYMPPEAAAQSTPTTQAEGEGPVSFVSQSSFVESEGSFAATFNIAEPDLLPPTAEVDVTIFSVLDDISDLASEPQKLLNRLSPQSVESLRNRNGEVEIAFEVRNSSSGSEADVLLPGPGVYPLVVDFRVQSEIVQSIRTNLIRLPKTSGEPNLAGSATDSHRLSLVLDVGVHGVTLQKANRFLVQAKEKPLTVVIDESTLTELELGGVEADMFLRRSEEISLVLSLGETADSSALASVGLGDLYQQRLSRLRQRAGGLRLEPKPTITTTVNPITAEGAAVLQSAGLRTVLNIRDSFGGSDGYGSLEGDSTRLQLISNRVSSPRDVDSSATWANRYLARLFIDQRTQREPLPTLLVLDETTPATFEAADLALLLESAESIFEFNTIESISEPLRAINPATAPASDLTDLEPAIRSAVSQIDSFETSYINGSTSPADYQDSLIAAIGDSISAAQRELRIQSLNEEISRAVQTIGLPSGQAVTVAARSVPVPLAIENSSQGSRKFLLRSDSDKVQIAQDERVLTVPPGNSSIDLDVEVRSLGVSPVQVSLFTPDGKNRLASTRFEVRSTAIPGLGLLLCLLGTSLLAFWWYVHAKRRRNKRATGQVAGLAVGQLDELQFKQGTSGLPSKSAPSTQPPRPTNELPSRNLT